jgi:hypothetical protein
MVISCKQPPTAVAVSLLKVNGGAEGIEPLTSALRTGLSAKPLVIAFSKVAATEEKSRFPVLSHS